MRRGLSTAELIRQDVLDLHPEPPRPPCSIPPRLLILACSATKATGEGLTARDRYQGPLWQTLRAIDPDGSKTFVCFLSAKFGLGDARSVLPHYDRVLTDADADCMAEGHTWACYPELPQSGRMTMAAKLRVANRDGPRRSPSGVLTLLVRERASRSATSRSAAATATSGSPRRGWPTSASCVSSLPTPRSQSSTARSA